MMNTVIKETSARRAGLLPSPDSEANASVFAKSVVSIAAFTPVAIAEPNISINTSELFTTDVITHHHPSLA